MSTEEPVTPALRKEFWGLIDKTGSESAEEAAALKDRMLGEAFVCQRYFYEDALWALKQGRPFKSAAREKCEIRVKMPASRIQMNEDLIRKIAAQEPVTGNGGVQIIFTKELITTTLAGMESTQKRLNLLFTRP